MQYQQKTMTPDPEASHALSRPRHGVGRIGTEPSVFGLIAHDLDFAHRRRWPRHPGSPAHRLWLLASSPSLWLLLAHRTAHWLHGKRAAAGRWIWCWRLLAIGLAPAKWAIQAYTRSQIDNFCRIAPGVAFSDQGHIIYGAVETGPGTVIGPRVTVGRSLPDNGHPVIGADCWIASDCVIYGAIRIGDGATLLPGTVLTKSVPARALVEGNPARIVRLGFDNAHLREGQGLDAPSQGLDTAGH